MGRERAEERGLFPPRVLTPDGGLRPVHVDPQARVRETAPEGVASPGHDHEVAVDPELHPARDLDDLFQQSPDRHPPPQPPYAMSLPPPPIAFPLVREI